MPAFAGSSHSIALGLVTTVGEAGAVVNVARGYMRNYLEPRGLAEAATPARIAEVQRTQEQRIAARAKKLEEDRELVDLQRRLSEARRAATIGAVTQGIAHNLNNLLGVVIGSEGTLGVVTKATLRLLRKPESVLTLLAAFDSIDEAGGAVGIGEFSGNGAAPVEHPGVNRPAGGATGASPGPNAFPLSLP